MSHYGIRLKCELILFLISSYFIVWYKRRLVKVKIPFDVYLQGIYEPGKRHWLKMKKDYLLDGSLADSVDLVVLGAWYGTGNKGKSFKRCFYLLINFFFILFLFLDVYLKRKSLQSDTLIQ